VRETYEILESAGRFVALNWARWLLSSRKLKSWPSNSFCIPFHNS